MYYVFCAGASQLACASAGWPSPFQTVARRRSWDRGALHQATVPSAPFARSDLFNATSYAELPIPCSTTYSAVRCGLVWG